MKFQYLLLKSLLLISLLLSASVSNSQQLGSFDKLTSFNGESRTLSYFVPSDYDSTKYYSLMVCLHGLGDNSNNFRNALIDYLSWNQFITQTIFVCPDGGSDQNKDFYSPNGDEMIIVESINDAKANYKIDTTKIILEGFSLGGRSALKFGLENTEMFQGLLLNTPAIQGIADLNNDEGMSSGYMYENASRIPISIIHGDEDIAYLNLDKLLYKKLLENNGIVQHYLVEGMAHSIPGRSITEPAVNFLKNPTPNEEELEFLEIVVPERTISKDVEAYCKIRSVGSEILSQIILYYEIDGVSGNVTTTSTFYPFEIVTIPLKLNMFQLDYGKHTIKILWSENREYETSFEIIEKGDTLPFFEGFESELFPPQKWILNESGSIFTWMLDPEVKKTGNSSIFLFNTILLMNNINYSEDLLSPVLDLTSAEKPALTFDVAYNYHLYTPPYFTQNLVLADTLSIFISEDCGETYSLIYKKGGADLATAAEPITNPLELEQCMFIPTDEQWRTEKIDLSDYRNLDKAIFNFSYKSALGGSINIDNISFKNDDGTSIEEQKNNSTISIYPNPAQDILYIKNNDLISKVRIFNSNGIEVYSNQVNQASSELIVNLSDFPTGFYIVEIYLGNSIIREKLIINQK